MLTSSRVYRCEKDGSAIVVNHLAIDPSYAFGFCRECRKEVAARQDQLPMSDHGLARTSDPDTSQQAALRIRPGSARWALLQAHAKVHGLTDEEACELAGLSLQSEYATRCSELMRAGLIADTDVTRLGASGMSRLVRIITAAGRTVVDDQLR